MGGVLFLQKTQKHRNEAVNRVRMLTFWREETVDRKGIKSPECQRMTVNNHQGRLVTHSPSLQACADAKERP